MTSRRILRGSSAKPVLARTADEYGKQGLVERSFQSLLEIEPLIHEASILLNASSVVRQRDRERVSDFS
jgi:hypothetical protein